MSSNPRSYEQHLKVVLKNMRAAFATLGGFWGSDAPFKWRRLVFRGCVGSAAMNGIEPFLPSAA
eukprot:95171-Lingulodinium_polyedra.AAC.1